MTSRLPGGVTNVCSFPTRSAALRARLVGVLCALGVVLLSGSAWAVAPMCDETGQSIAAPFPLMPSYNGELRESAGCDQDGTEVLRGAPNPDRPGQSSNAPTSERMPRVASPRFPRLGGERLAIPPPVRAAPRAGWASGVYRPPRG